MEEFETQSGEHGELASKQAEAAQLARLTGQLYEIFHGEISGQGGADGALDMLSDYCLAVGARDPEMGHILVQALESNKVADRDQNFSDLLRVHLGLPERDWGAPSGPGQPELPASGKSAGSPPTATS